MKKIIFILMMICLWGCTQQKNINQIENTQILPAKLIQKIKMTMPYSIYEELEDKGVCTQIDDTLLLGNDAQNPTLRLDFTYKGDQLIQYVSKEYGFVESMNEKHINEDEAKSLVKLFAKTFLEQDVILKTTTDMSGYDTGDYITFEDQNRNLYLVQFNKNMVIKMDSQSQ